MQDISRNAGNWGYDISRSYRNAGYTSVKKLAGIQKKNLGFIKKVYAKAAEAKETDKNLFLPVHFEWLCDNYYIIEREIKNILKSFSYAPRLPAVRGVNLNLNGKVNLNGSRGSSQVRIYAVLNGLVGNCGGEITPRIIEDYIEAVQNSPGSSNYLTVGELSLARIMLAASLCSAIADICGELLEYLNYLSGNKNRNNLYLPDSLAHSLGFCIRNLRFCSVYRFETLFEKCSGADKIFNGDPAGIYKNMDKATKNYYRRRLSEIAAENNWDEIETAEKIYGKALGAAARGAHEKQTHIGYYLLKKRTPKKSYFAITLALLAVFVFLASRLAGAAFIFLILPLWELAKQITDFAFARFIETMPLPKLDLKNIPGDKKTLVCITTLLFGEGKDDGLFIRLENYYNANKDKNINFAILGDFKDNQNRETENDGKITEYAAKKIEDLNKK